ncbi:hypothetical protein [Amycolatopsis thermoflava]|uniref:hypothetical protein n=1 Tax=Amycolatopsis thermoflava TaxID=84480 RepID=UPI0037FC09F3
MSAKKRSQRKPTARTGQKSVAQARSAGRRNGLLWGGAAVAVVALLVTVIVAVTRSADTKQVGSAATDINNAPATTAVGRTDPPPWPAPSDAPAAVRAAGLPMLSAESNVEHIHAHLDVRVDGNPVEVPANLGIDQKRGSISPLHTHDTTGVIHIESPVKRQFTLGELFSEWDVSLSADNIGALRAADGKTLRVYVNGTPRTGNPAAITFAAHDEIALIYGTPQPDESVPNGYDFPPGN